MDYEKIMRNIFVAIFVILMCFLVYNLPFLFERAAAGKIENLRILWDIFKHFLMGIPIGLGLSGCFWFLLRTKK